MHTFRAFGDVATQKLTDLRAAVAAYNQADTLLAQFIAAKNAIEVATKRAEQQLPLDQARTQNVAGLRAAAQRAVASANNAKTALTRAQAAGNRVRTTRQARGLQGYFNALALGYFGAFGDAVDDATRQTLDAVNAAIAAANAAVAEASKPSPDPTVVTSYVGQAAAAEQSALAAALAAENAATSTIASLPTGPISTPTTPTPTTPSTPSSPVTPETPAATAPPSDATPSTPSVAPTAIPSSGTPADWAEGSGEDASLGPAGEAVPASTLAPAPAQDRTLLYVGAGLLALFLLRR